MFSAIINNIQKKEKKNIIINKIRKYSIEHIIEKLYVLLIKLTFPSHYTESYNGVNNLLTN